MLKHIEKYFKHIYSYSYINDLCIILFPIYQVLFKTFMYLFIIELPIQLSIINCLIKEIK